MKESVDAMSSLLSKHFSSKTRRFPGFFFGLWCLAPFLCLPMQKLKALKKAAQAHQAVGRENIPLASASNDLPFCTWVQ